MKGREVSESIGVPEGTKRSRPPQLPRWDLGGMIEEETHEMNVIGPSGRVVKDMSRTGGNVR